MEAADTASNWLPEGPIRMRSSCFKTLLPVFVFTIASTSFVQAQDAASGADKAFVAKVSQGGRYEVEASQLALTRAKAQDVKDLATSEVHDHEQVNRRLMAISAAKHVSIAAGLNAEFTEKLAHLRGLSGADFDAVYLSEMATIHDKDEKLFAQEAMDGGASEYKVFAAETDLIVKRHIGGLHGTDVK